MRKDERESILQQGRNQVLYLMLTIGDENVAHDHWHPKQAQFLFETRVEIMNRLEHKQVWPEEWPDFRKYTYSPG